MNKKWQIYQTNEEEVKKIADKYQINQLLTSIIVNRKIEEEKIDVFLHPTRQNFHDPFLMPDMKIAVERILKAIENKEKTNKQENKTTKKKTKKEVKNNG